MGVTVESSWLSLQQVCAPEASGFNKASFLFINPSSPPAPPAQWKKNVFGMQTWSNKGSCLDQDGNNKFVFSQGGIKEETETSEKAFLLRIVTLSTVSIGPDVRTLQNQAPLFNLILFGIADGGANLTSLKKLNDISGRLGEVSHSEKLLNRKNANLRGTLWSPFCISSLSSAVFWLFFPISSISACELV